MFGLDKVVSACLALAVLLFFHPVLSYNVEEKLDDKIAVIRAILENLKDRGVDVSVLEQVLQKAEMNVKGHRSSEMVVKLYHRVQKAWDLYEKDPKKAVKVISLLQDIYLLGGSVYGITAVLTDTAEQLVEQFLANPTSDESALLLSKSETLLEGVKNVLGGKPLNMKVIRSGSVDGEEAEVSIATITTSQEVVKVYFTEDRLRYPNETVVISKKAFINLGNTVIIQRETLKSVQPASSEREILMGENTGIGVVISLSRSANKLQLDKTEYDVVVQSYSFEQNLVRLVLSSNRENAGKLVIIDVDKDFMKNYLPRDISVRVDGAPATLAQSITDVLADKPSEPKYFLAITGRGLQIVLYIPRWSTRVVIIGSSASLSFQISIPSVVGEDMKWLATTVAAVSLMSVVLIGRLLRRR